MIKAIIIDDEPLARNLLKEFLPYHNEIEVVAECGDGFEAVKAIQTHKPELLFLDIQMPKINGFETLELLDYKPAVIFTTAFDEYAIKAFEQNAIDYLLKPFSQERFNNAVTKFLTASTNNSKTENFESFPKKHADESTRIVVKNGSNILILQAENVSHIEAYDDYVKIHSGNTFYLKKKTMNYYEQVLDTTNFIRVHRSFILNIDFLTRIDAAEKGSYHALLKNGDKIPLSKTGYSKLKELLNL